jgi:Ca2+-binding EF-hand superfamily protein
MGAAASVKQLYGESMSWFKNYIDTETYLADFNSFDKDGGGSISFVEFQRRITEKAKADTEEAKFWQMLLQSGQVIKVAHKSASLQDKDAINVSEYKALLVHVFVGSVLWRFFEFADSVVDDDAGDKRLSFEEFRIAVHAFCKAHAGEDISDEVIRDDFHLLDTSMSNSIGFMQLCKYTSNFIDPSFSTPNTKVPHEDKGSSKVAKMLGSTTTALNQSQHLMSDLEKGNKFYKMQTPAEKSQQAMLQLNRVLENKGLVMEEERERLKLTKGEVSLTDAPQM